MSISIEQLELSKLDTNKHKDMVKKVIFNVINELTERASNHDNTKLESPEVELFAEYGPKLKGLTYGSDEYNKCKIEMGKALQHHYQHNRHHPEHFKDPILLCVHCNSQILKPEEYKCPHCNNVLKVKECYTVNKMNLVDIVEMFCDWYASCKRHDNGDIYKSIDINKKRFLISNELCDIFENTAKLFKENNI